MLGEQVRNIRKKRGITLKELAEKTGLSTVFNVVLVSAINTAFAGDS